MKPNPLNFKLDRFETTLTTFRSICECLLNAPDFTKLRILLNSIENPFFPANCMVKFAKRIETTTIEFKSYLAHDFAIFRKNKLFLDIPY